MSIENGNFVYLKFEVRSNRPDQDLVWLVPADELCRLYDPGNDFLPIKQLFAHKSIILTDVAE